MSTSTEEAIAIGQAGAALNAEKDKRRIFGDTGDSNTDPVVMSRDIDLVSVDCKVLKANRVKKVRLD
jgi:hypothetical protein